MEAIPTAPPDNGRDPESGRFTTGNGFSRGRGNPFAQRVHNYRAALLAAVSPDDIAAVVAALVAAAKEGDVAAAKELLDRTLGKAPASVSLTGPDGEALPGVSLQVVLGVVMEAITDGETRVRVAEKLRELSLAGPGDGTGAGA